MMIVSAAAGLAASWGCGEGPPSVETSEEEAEVKGSVKLDGKLVTKGEVIFDPSNYKRKSAASRTAPIGEDGSYSIKTLVGTNQIFVNIQPAGKKKAARTDFPPMTFEVKSGDNLYEIDLSTTSNSN